MKKSAAKPKIPAGEATPGRKQRIVRTAARLFAAHGYKATTMDALAETCEINKATLYYYYPSKADILLDISVSVRRDLDPLSKLAEKEPDAITGLSILINGILEIANRDRDSFYVYFQESAHFQQYLTEEQYSVFRESERSLVKILYGILNRGMYSGDLIECDVRYVGRLLIFMVLSVARWPEAQIDVARVMNAIRTVFLNGLISVRPAA